MPVTPSLFALAALAMLAACGTKTPLTLPAPTASGAPATINDSNKAATEPRP